MSISFSSLPHVIGASLFFILAVRTIFQFSGKNTKVANYFLSTLFLIFSAMLLDEFFISIGLEGKYFVGDNILLDASHLLLGPLTFCYVSTMLMNVDNPYKKWLHFIPFAFFLSLSVFFLEANNKILFYCFIFLYLASLLPYILVSLKALSAYVNDAKTLESTLEFHNLNWVRAWLLFMLVLALYVSLNPLINWLYPSFEYYFDIHYLITFMAFLLLVYPDSARQVSLADNSAKQTKDKLETTKYSPDGDPYLHELYTKLNTQMIDKELYLINGLSLTDISQHISETTHQISAALNQVGCVCFYDFVNNFRVDCAKKLLVLYPSRAIIDIAMEAGFNSKSAFYSAFSKRETLSPSQYRQNNAISH